jgi:biopolymer transport protein ExbD
MALKRRNRVEPEFSLAAMIDVIFLLLMFFMLTSNFVTPNALNLQLPSSKSKSLASPSLSVSIKNSGELFIDRTSVKPASLELSLRSKMLSLKEGQDKTITVVAEKGTAIDDVVFVLEAARNLGLKTILATDPNASAN